MKRRVLSAILVVSICGCSGWVPKSQREDYVRQHPNLKPEIAATIIEGGWRRGMTREEVVASIGRPNDINTSVGSWGKHEQWVYGKSSFYLYFENGILTSWQN